MCPDLIVIGSVISHKVTQLRLVEHDDVIEAFALDRSDEPLNEAVLPKRARRGRVITGPHCPDAASFLPRAWDQRGHLLRLEEEIRCVPDIRDLLAAFRLM